MDFEVWERAFREWLECASDHDSAHAVDHLLRVVNTAKKLARREQADLQVVIPAAWLHDCVAVSKDSPLRSKASVMAAEKASDYLSTIGYRKQLIPAIHHCIVSHSFSAGVKPETIEAKVVQDADRLDALGAIGLFRCCTVGGRLGRTLYHIDDPFANERALDDGQYTLDHFFVKLFKLPDLMQTEAGFLEAKERVSFLKLFIKQLEMEIMPK